MCCALHAHAHAHAHAHDAHVTYALHVTCILPRAAERQRLARPASAVMTWLGLGLGLGFGLGLGARARARG
eukprot:scaffold35067_cov41-Phaeocystis_antarctica.AAC.1